jgi:enoyl-CoA hydratase/carnithine racemase
MIERALFREEHDIFRASVRKFVEREIVPFHAKWEEDGVVPRELWLKAGAAGLPVMSATRKRGKSGASTTATLPSRHARWTSSTRWFPAAELDAAGKDWTDKLAQRSPMAIALAKRSFNADSDSIRGVSNFALHALKMFYDTPESKEGVAAFNEKRTPDFNKFSS